MSDDQKNTILFFVLSAVIVIGWQIWVGGFGPQQKPATPPQSVPGTTTPGAPGAPPAPGTPAEPAAKPLTREEALARSPRVRIETPRLAGSVALKGGRIDDLSLTQYRETVEPNSPPIVLLSPSGSPHPFYAEFGWLASSGATIKRPDENTLWTQEGSGPLTVDRPVTLVYDNGEGLTFRRTISVDDKYMFSVRDEVANKTASPVALHPFALVSRHGTPKTEGYLVSHEGLIGVLADKLQEETYDNVEKKKSIAFQNTKGWLGFTDKYWAATLIPDPAANLSARFQFGQLGPLKTYQADYFLDPVTIPAGGSATASTRLFAGAKEVAVIDGYGKVLMLDRFDRLIDWAGSTSLPRTCSWRSTGSITSSATSASPS